VAGGRRRQEAAGGGRKRTPEGQLRSRCRRRYPRAARAAWNSRTFSQWNEADDSSQSCRRVGVLASPRLGQLFRYDVPVSLYRTILQILAVPVKSLRFHPLGWCASSHLAHRFASVDTNHGIQFPSHRARLVVTLASSTRRRSAASIRSAALRFRKCGFLACPPTATLPSFRLPADGPPRARTARTLRLTWRQYTAGHLRASCHGGPTVFCWRIA
jgi:hypothetical protein